jgi:hypothetical protein
MCRRPSSRPHSGERRTPATLFDSSNQASDEPGAVQGRVNDVILTLLVWVLLGATLALAGVIVAYIERRD